MNKKHEDTWVWDAVEWFDTNSNIDDMDYLRLEHVVEKAQVLLEIGYPEFKDSRWVIKFDEVTSLTTSYSSAYSFEQRLSYSSASGTQSGRIYLYENLGLRITIDASSASIATRADGGDTGLFRRMGMTRVLNVPRPE